MGPRPPVLACLLLLAVVAQMLLFGVAAHADAPYVRSHCTTHLPDGTAVTLALHFDDGVIWTDPASPVVTDADGRLIGVGPSALLYYLFCASRIEDVVLYAPNERLIVTADPAALQPNSPVVDLTQTYPSSLSPYGFVSRPAEAREAILLQIRAVPLYWTWLVWYAVLWLLVVMPFALPKRPGLRYAILPMLAGVSRILLFAAGMALSAFVALIADPASAIVFGILVTVSFLIALAFRLLKRRRRIDNTQAPA